MSAFTTVPAMRKRLAGVVLRRMLRMQPSAVVNANGENNARSRMVVAHHGPGASTTRLPAVPGDNVTACPAFLSDARASRFR